MLGISRVWNGVGTLGTYQQTLRGEGSACDFLVIHLCEHPQMNFLWESKGTPPMPPAQRNK